MQLAGKVAKPPDDAPLGMLCDLVASMVSLDPATRQSLLAELDVAVRCARLLELVQAPSQARKRTWPTGPSLN